MATEYVTVKRSNNAEFLKYLWGRNSKDIRAVPVKTYNLGTPEESVTFELRKATEIQRPNLFKFIASLIKLRSFILILFPLFFVLTKNYVDDRLFDPISIVLASVGMLFLFSGLNIRNDIHDHISGFDRVNIDSSPKPLREGWITARQASWLSMALILVSAVVAFPAFVFQPELVRVLIVSSVLFFVGRFAKKNSYKHQHFGELILFLLAGPGLVSGYQVALGAGIDTEILCFGVLWGFAVLYLVQVNNFAHIMTSSQSKISNTITKLGFDLSQKFLLLMWGAFIVLWTAFHHYFGSRYWTIFGTMLLIFWSVPLFMKITDIKSPMGSGPRLVKRIAHQTFLAMVFIFFLQSLWVLWVDAN
ncbi:UbiA family prenyltransferase [Pseudobdellovibrio exovorus]|uniref:1,4-dihydroxy-2-naphthoate octaprenyltransferase n=1 Tax=Pseudobdellovibrio exovorus JSS TaxID=1184267 RepID=M4VA88_9BACT|nr:UbiA family prenyltransferase [Pseudobdellovibrio exovorus]AGH96322.1 1,4-dihydroxy-2-naphthoate octaprenyltransferase [Pseudobdellovibrio exovorus JSS]